MKNSLKRIRIGLLDILIFISLVGLTLFFFGDIKILWVHSIPISIFQKHLTIPFWILMVLIPFAFYMMYQANDEWTKTIKIVTVIIFIGFIVCPYWDGLIEQDIYQENLSVTSNSVKIEKEPESLPVNILDSSKNKISKVLFTEKDSINKEIVLNKNNLSTKEGNHKNDSISVTKKDLVFQESKTKEAYSWKVKVVY